MVKMAKKKRRYKKRKSTATKADIVVVVLILASILLAVLIYTKSGVVGQKLNEILRWNDRNNAIHTSSRNFCSQYKTCM